MKLRAGDYPDFGKPGVYNVTLKVWGPHVNDTLTKPAYIIAASVSTEKNNSNENWVWDDQHHGRDYHHGREMTTT